MVQPAATVSTHLRSLCSSDRSGPHLVEGGAADAGCLLVGGRPGAVRAGNNEVAPPDEEDRRHCSGEGQHAAHHQDKVQTAGETGAQCRDEGGPGPEGTRSRARAKFP